MMYIKERDRNILKFIEEYGSITITICSNLFFNSYKNGYYMASRRLKAMFDNKMVKRTRENVNDEYIYYFYKPLNAHRLKLLEVYSKINCLGRIEKFEIEKVVEGTKRKNDGFIEVAIDKGNYDEVFPIILEIDYTHETDSKKIKEIVESNYYQDIYGFMPIFIIVQRYEWQRRPCYESTAVNCVDWSLSSLSASFLA